MQPESSLGSIKQLTESVRRNKTIKGIKEEGAESTKPFICGQSVNTRQPRPPRLHQSFFLCWLCVYVSMYMLNSFLKKGENVLPGELFLSVLDVLMSSLLDLKRMLCSQRVTEPLKRRPPEGRTSVAKPRPRHRWIQQISAGLLGGDELRC